MNHITHLKNTFSSVSKNQWFGLVIAVIGSTLAWIKLVFLISPLKGKKIIITKYQYYALFIGWIITTFGWLKVLALVDPLNNKIVCNCKCN